MVKSDNLMCAKAMKPSVHTSTITTHPNGTRKRMGLRNKIYSSTAIKSNVKTGASENPLAVYFTSARETNGIPI